MNVGWCTCGNSCMDGVLKRLLCFHDEIFYESLVLTFPLLFDSVVHDFHVVEKSLMYLKFYVSS